MAIVGVSFDDYETNQAWAEEEEYLFELWTDDDERTLAVTYGAAANTSAPYAARITVILDAESNLVLEYLTDISVGAHPNEVLEDCQALFGG